MNADMLAAWLTIAAVALWVAVFVARELWTEWRIQRAERQWRAWFDALPEPERRAGAERLWDAVWEEDEPCGCAVHPRWCAWNGPCCDACSHDLAAERLRADLDGCDSADGTFLTYGPDANLPRLLAWTRNVGTHGPRQQRSRARTHSGAQRAGRAVVMTACSACAASPCHAHARIAKANEQDQRQRVAEQVAALETEINRRWPGPPPAPPKHPAPGCPCHGCDGRDRAMEARAEERAATGRGDYAGLAEQEWAEYRREMRDDWWTP